MLYVGIDVAKIKHDCCILGDYGEVLEPNLQIMNNLEGFLKLESLICNHNDEKGFIDIKIGLESTGHYSIAITEFFVNKGYTVITLNPLLTSLFRKAHTLRKTKTDKTDATTIATMLVSENSSPTVSLSYQFEELKSLTRHRRRLIAARSKLKVTVKRLLTIGFPELEQNEKNVHSKWIYAVLSEFPDASKIASSHMTRLYHIVTDASRNMISKERVDTVRELARKSIGRSSYALRFEMIQTIEQIRMYDRLIADLDNELKVLVDGLESPIMSIPGISYIFAGIIISEIGDIKRFDKFSKLLAYSGMEPSTYQSGGFRANKTPMVKRGSSYLRWALMEAAQNVANNDPTFRSYLDKKCGEGKHYFVALSHTAKKLLRVIYYLLKHDEMFVVQ